MIYFEDWTLRADNQVMAHQFDHLSRALLVSGDMPADWEWSMLVQVGEAMDILPLTFMQEGLGILLTAQQLCVSGYYKMQLRATRGDLVKHTNKIDVYIPSSISGDGQWPVVPSEFTDLERRAVEAVKKTENAAAEAENYAGQAAAAGKCAEEAGEAAQDAAMAAGQSAVNAAASEQASAQHETAAEGARILAESYASHPPIVGENGTWWGWDGTQYTDSGKPSQGELTQKQGNTRYANALKGTASGAAIRVDDVSPLEHTVSVKVSGENIDPETVTVTGCGKNMIDADGLCNDFLVKNADGSYTLTKGSNTNDRISAKVPCCLPANTQFCLSAEFVSHTTAGASLYAVLTLADGTQFTSGIPFSTSKRVLTSTQPVTQVQVYLQGSEVEGAHITFRNLQVELGGSVTEYEPYNSASATYTLAEDGSCEVTSIAPTMTLLTDNPDVVMDCEYNRDINKAFEQLTQAIISMGGNI